MVKTSKFKHLLWCILPQLDLEKSSSGQTKFIVKSQIIFFLLKQILNIDQIQFSFLAWKISRKPMTS